MPDQPPPGNNPFKAFRHSNNDAYLLSAGVLLIRWVVHALLGAHWQLGRGAAVAVAGPARNIIAGMRVKMPLSNVNPDTFYSPAAIASKATARRSHEALLADSRMMWRVPTLD